MLQNILLVKDCVSENALGSFNDTFDPPKLPMNHTTRSSPSYLKQKQTDAKPMFNQYIL